MSTETEKTYVFGNDGMSGIVSMLSPLLQQRGIDPNILLAMNNGNGFCGNNGSWFVWFLFIILLWGRNGFGMNADGLSNQINNDYGRDLLMQAINGNRDAISQLSTTLNCDINSIQGTLGSVMSSIQSVGNQVGMSSQSVINAIQSGNCSIGNQIATSACSINNSITTQGYENRLANAEQTAIISGKIDNQTTLINEKFCEIAQRDLQNKIDSLQATNTQLQNQISNANQTAIFNQMISNATAPIATAVNNLQTDLTAVKGQLPSTLVVPNNQYTAVPSIYLYGSGIYGNNSIWG